MTDPVNPVPKGHHTVTPYLIVEEPDPLIEFMRTAFGAELVDRNDDPEGRLMHADLVIGDSHLMMGQASDEHPATRAMIHLYLPDADGVYEKALAAGAQSVREPETMFYGDRSGGVTDSSGTLWWISTHVEDVSPEEMERRMREMGG
jgi:uncharacterized glyoxalase superfamily protein PhnB